MIHIYHPDAIDIFKKDARPEELSAGFKFAEGPLWHPEGYLLISDTPQNRMFQILSNGITKVYKLHSGGMCITYKYLSDMIGSNGLAFDKQGNIIICQHGNHCIASMDKEKNIIPLCSSYNGKPFNSPNDVVMKSNGAVYFTDPPYGLVKQVLNSEHFQPHGGVYCYFKNAVTLLSTDLSYPNGICLSADEKFLFVSSNHPDEKMIYRFELSKDGEVVHKEIFTMMNADGIKLDPFGNLYAATIEGIIVLSAGAEKIAKISLPSMATNIAFGGEDLSTLFITTPSTVYSVEMRFQKNRCYDYNPFAKKFNYSNNLGRNVEH